MCVCVCVCVGGGDWVVAQNIFCGHYLHPTPSLH